jgi:hypothetical protein
MGIMGSMGTASGAPIHGNSVTIIVMALSMMLNSTDPVNPEVNSWATPVFGIVYVVLVVVALAALIASKGIPAPVKVAVGVAIFVLPFVGSVAWIIYSQVRHRGLGRTHKGS